MRSHSIWIPCCGSRIQRWKRRDFILTLSHSVRVWICFHCFRMQAYDLKTDTEIERFRRSAIHFPLKYVWSFLIGCRIQIGICDASFQWSAEMRLLFNTWNWNPRQFFYLTHYSIRLSHIKYFWQRMLRSCISISDWLRYDTKKNKLWILNAKLEICHMKNWNFTENRLIFGWTMLKINRFECKMPIIEFSA